MAATTAIGLSRQRQGQLGVNVVERIVLHKWNSRWQPVDAVNDDGVDGLIFLEKDGLMTGQVVYVQVKCWSRKSVTINSRRVRAIKATWGHLIGAVILVRVDPKSLRAQWVDLKSFATGSSQTLTLPKSDLSNDKGAIAKLCGTLHDDLGALRVTTETSDFDYLRGQERLQSAARCLYKSLVRVPTSGGPCVTFDRLGWRHMTRRSRSRLAQVQSFALLGAVRPILQAASSQDLVELPNLASTLEKNLALTAAVQFPHRQACIVRIIIRERVGGAGAQYRFLTVYEPRRRKSLIGN